MINEEENIDEVIEAKRQGHKFIKVFLHPEIIQRNANEVAISGAIVLKAEKRGVGAGGLPDYHFTAEGGETLIFRFNRAEREFMCWVFDDKGPGYFSPIGYNRDLLASHLEENFFIIPDEKVKKDIENRYQYMKENPGKRSVNAGAPILTAPTETPEDIDAQIIYLKEKKRAMGTGNSSKTVYRMQPLTDEEKKEKRNQTQREYRQRQKEERARQEAEKKKAEKEKQLENA